MQLSSKKILFENVKKYLLNAQKVSRLQAKQQRFART
jgi:hypothetical protein